MARCATSEQNSLELWGSLIDTPLYYKKATIGSSRYFSCLSWENSQSESKYRSLGPRDIWDIWSFGRSLSSLRIIISSSNLEDLKAERGGRDKEILTGLPGYEEAMKICLGRFKLRMSEAIGSSIGCQEAKLERWGDIAYVSNVLQNKELLIIFLNNRLFFLLSLRSTLSYKTTTLLKKKII